MLRTEDNKILIQMQVPDSEGGGSADWAFRTQVELQTALIAGICALASEDDFSANNNVNIYRLANLLDSVNLDYESASDIDDLNVEKGLSLIKNPDTR